MAPLLPQIRVIVDWEDDAFFEPTEGQSTPNLIPTALSLVDVDIALISTATYTHKAEVTDYGIQYQQIVSGTNNFGGIRYGYDGVAGDTIPVLASTTYRVTAWMRGIAGSYGSTPVRFEIRDQSFNSITASSNLTLTASWAKYTATFTTGVGDTHVILSITKNNNVNDITFDVAGLMLTLGSATVDYFNTGGTYSAYEDITRDVMQANWSIDIETKMRIPKEGELSLLLRNDTQKYSPRYLSSPLYGAFKHGLRVRVEAKRDGGAYVVMWAGWVTNFGVKPGNVNYRASITATQGIFNLDAAPLQDNLQEDVTFDEVLPNILMAGWYPAITPYVFVADISRVDDNAWTPDEDDFITTLDTGITEFPLVGDGWSDTDTRATKVLKDMLEVEQGWLYLGRDGRMNFKSRETINWDAAVDHTLDLDTDVNNSDYVFAPGEINSVNLTYYPSGESENQILWQRRGTKLVGPRGEKRVDAKFQYEEGEKKTVKSINPFGSGGDDSTISATIAGGDPYDSRYYSATVELRNGKGVITIYNRGAVDAYFSLTLKGTIEVNADSEQVQVVADNTAKIRDIRINNKLLKDEDMAEDLGNYIISQHSADYDEFRSFTVMSRNATWLDRMLDISMGDVVSLSETQTAVEDKKHLIIGESHEWMPGKIQSTFKTTRVDETAYWILGTSKLSHETVLAY